MTEHGIDLRMIIEIVGGVGMLLLSVIGFFLREKVHGVETELAASKAQGQSLALNAAGFQSALLRAEQQIAELRTSVRALETKAAADTVEMRQITQALSAISEMRAEMALKFVSREDMATLLERVDHIAQQVSDMRVAMATGKAAHG